MVLELASAKSSPSVRPALLDPRSLLTSLAVESVVIVSHLCLNYTIHIPAAKVEEYRVRPGESERDRRERIFKPTNGITLTPKSLPLEFRRRVKKA